MASDEPLTPEQRMDLPPPVPTQEKAEAPEMNVVKRQGSEANPEFLPPVAQSQQPVQQAQTATQVQPATATADHSLTAQSGTTTASSANPAIAEDVDLIEKEWVEKAKAIVNHTRDDPHRQSKEINKMKADYIKKRYNKDVQVSE